MKPRNRDHLRSVPPPSERTQQAAAAPIVPADVPALLELAPPPELKDLELRIWLELLAEYQERLSPDDRQLFAKLVRREFDYRTARSEVDRLGLLIKSPSGYPIQNPYLAIMNKAAEQGLKLSIQLGLTPMARSRVKGSGRGRGGPKKPSSNAWAKLRSLTD